MTGKLSGPTATLDFLVDALVCGPRRVPGDDVLVATGELVLTWCDIDLPGALPLRLTRRYGSAYRHGRWFGRSWASWLDQHLELAAEKAVLCTSDGRVIRYPVPEPGTRVFPADGPHWALAWDGAPGGACAVADPRRGVIRYFGATHRCAARPGADGVVLPLLAVADRNATGAQTLFGYDAYGRLVSSTAPSGHVRTAEYDRAGLVIACHDPFGATTRVHRDGWGRPERVVAPDGGETAVGWTADGLPAFLTCGDSHEQWTYDPEGRLTGHRDASGAPTRIERGRFGLPVAHTTPDGIRHLFEYDGELRLTAVTGPGGTRSFRYDVADRLVWERDEGGAGVEYRRDAAGRIVVRTRTATGSTDADDVRHSRAAGDGAGPVRVEYEYDVLDRVTAVVSDGGRDARHHDALGRMVSRITPSGLEPTWTYDAFGRPLLLQCGPFTVEYSYDANGREIERRLAPDLAIVQAWDSAGRPASQAVRRGLPVDAITAALDPALGPRDVWLRTYAYDERGRCCVREERFEPAVPPGSDAAHGPAETGRTHGGFHLVVRTAEGTPIVAVRPDGTVTRATGLEGPHPDDQFHEGPRALPTDPWSMLRAHDSLDRYLPRPWVR